MTDIFNENSKTDEKVITDVLTVHDALAHHARASDDADFVLFHKNLLLL